MNRLTLALSMGPLMAAAGNYDSTNGPLPPAFAAGQTDAYLTDLAVADMQADQDFLAPQIFPVVPVGTQHGKFKVWDRGSLLRPEFRAHAYGDRPVQGSWKTNDASYGCEHRSLEKPLAPSDRASSRDPLQPEQDATNYLTTQARLDIDLLWTQAYFRPEAAWSWKYQGVASNPNRTAGTPEFLQFDQPGVNVAQVIRGRVERMALMTGRRPNVLVLGSDVYASLVFNPDIVDRVKYVQQGIADKDLMAAFFNVEKVLVAGGVYNAAPEGLADSFKYLVDPKGMLLCYAAPRPSKETPSAGYMFIWERLYEAFEGDQNRVLNEMALIRRGYDDRSGVRWVQAHTAIGLEVVAPDLGMYFKDVVTASASDW
jgi:hypothetical protein